VGWLALYRRGPHLLVVPAECRWSLPARPAQFLGGTAATAGRDTTPAALRLMAGIHSAGEAAVAVARRAASRTALAACLADLSVLQRTPAELAERGLQILMRLPEQCSVEAAVVVALTKTALMAPLRLSKFSFCASGTPVFSVTGLRGKDHGSVETFSSSS
jgi:hypothetical protein